MLRFVAATDAQRAALEVDGESTSYAQLSGDADRLAQRLLDDHGAGPRRIAIRLESTRALLTATVAVARAGMVAVPIDPTAPLDWVERILAAVDADIVLTDIDGDEALSIPTADPLRHVAEPPEGGVDEPIGELASIVFTSGSTGDPKGILIPTDRRPTHADSSIATFGTFDQGLRIGLLAAGTVPTTYSILQGLLLLRGTIVAYELRRLGIAPLADWLERERVFGFLTVPTVMRQLLPIVDEGRVFRDLHMVGLWGETTTWADIEALRRHLTRDAVIFNLYGLTETGLVAAMPIAADTPLADGPVPVGWPLPGRAIQIVGADGGPLDDGEQGEIVVETREASFGYAGLPDLSRSVFVDIGGGRRAVRTGDRGKRRPDGAIEHLGRVDELVKIRGNRVELGLLESALLALDGVAAAAAATFTDSSGDLRLAAFAVPSPGARPQPGVLRTELARRLPVPQLPDAIELVDRLPQLPGGKVDRRALGARARHLSPSTGRVPVPPANELERGIAEIWREVLELETVGIHDDFFDLGGDSLRAARVAVELERRMGIDRPLSGILEAPTVASFAAAVEAGISPWSALVPIRPAGSLPPLFLIHDGFGEVLYGRLLTRHLDPERPVYGLRAPALSGSRPAEKTLEGVAARYVRHIRSVSPHGPYALYGASLGGLVAFEIARQLVADGERITMLAFGDSAAPGSSSPLRAAPLASRGRARLAELRELPARDAAVQTANLAVRQLRHAAERITHFADVDRRRRRDQLVRTVSGDGPVPVDMRPDFVLAHYGMLAALYRPDSPLRANATLLRAERGGGERDLGWGKWIDGEVRITTIPGTHNDIHREPAVALVAAAIG